tara:strand:+ start:152 stop:472 length:321 start_codon:yes stop_codon:yes gene_type:complete
MNQIVKVMMDSKEKFTTEFMDWLPDNLHVWDAFVEETMKIRRRGYKHYSARTIVHVLRHHSAISETSSEWKINNNHSPYLARLFDLMFPAFAGMFEYRETKKVSKK